MLDLRPGPAGQRVLVKFSDHADSFPKPLNDREAGKALDRDRSIARRSRRRKASSVLTQAESGGAG